MHVLITGGGTAGHINPAIAIANGFVRADEQTKILFIGLQKGLEADLVPRAGYDISFVEAAGFDRAHMWKNISAAFVCMRGVAQAKRLIRQFQPDVAIGTGGFVCGPVLYAAHRYKVLVAIHEANAYAGMANRFISRFATYAYVNFEQTESTLYRAKKTMVTGNPMDHTAFQITKTHARTQLGIPMNERYVVAISGSRGSETLNTHFVEMIESFEKKDCYHLTIATGHQDYDRVKKVLSQKGLLEDSRIKLVPYLYDAIKHYAAADLVICRAGAMTCSEMCALGKPSIMIPSPYVAENHQMHNAKALADAGACVMLSEKEITAGRLQQTVTSLLFDDDKLVCMTKAAKSMSKTNATEMIVSSLVRHMHS